MKKLIFTTALITGVLCFTNPCTAQIANEPSSGNALSYDGNDWVKVSPGNMYQLQPFSVECWIKKSTTTVGTIINYGTVYAHYGWRLLAYTGVQFQIVGPSGAPAAYVSSTIPINDNTWHHITVTDNGVTLNLYIDGILNNTAASTAHYYTSGMRTYIGMARPEFNNLYPYSGQIDEVRIWNHALTQAEIRQNMTQKLTGTELGLVGYWRFDEGNGNTAFDSSPNGNNGTLY